MNGLLFLVRRRLVHTWRQNSILCLALGIVMFLPLASTFVARAFEAKFHERAGRVPLVLGARGNRFDLALAVLFHRDLALPTLTRSEAHAVESDGRAYVIPVQRRFRARGWPIVATTPDYFEVFAARVARGSLPLQLGDCVLGAKVARELGLDVGDRLFSDPVEVFDLAKPPALEMLVVGVLEGDGTANDRGVYCDIKTGWLLEGRFHGHEDAQQLDKQLVLVEADQRILKKTVVEYQKVTDENRDAFHLHGDPAELPINAAIVVPRDAKQRTILAARYEQSRTLQLLEPSGVARELTDYVLGIKTLVDGLAILIGLSTALLVGLVLSLTLRLRAAETRTLARIGVARATLVRLWCLEFAVVLLLALALAIAATLVVLHWAPTVLSLS